METGIFEIQSLDERLYFCDNRRSVAAALDLSRMSPGRLIATNAVAAFEMASLGVTSGHVRSLDLQAIDGQIAEERMAFYERIASLMASALQNHDDDADAVLTASDTFIYHIKLTVDHPLLLVSMLEHFAKDATTEVWFPPSTNISVDDRGLLRSDCSIISTVLEGLATSKGIKVHFYDSCYHSAERDLIPGPGVHLASIARGARTRARQFCAGSIAGLQFSLVVLDAKIRSLGSRSRDAVVLGWNCREIKTLRRERVAKGQRLIYLRSVGRPRSDASFGEKIVREMREAVLGSSPLMLRGVNMWPVLEPVLGHIASRYKWQRKAATRIERLLRTVRPRLIVVNTLTSLEPSVPSLRMAARKVGTPVCCWMHGGYGAYEDSGGYDISDHRLADCHVAYGEVSARAISSPSAISQLSGARSSNWVVSLGSPFFQRKYSVVPREQSTSGKPRIVLCLGPRYLSNRFYFGYGRDSVENGLCEESIALATSLSRFSFEFDIVVKDYPESEFGFFWSTFCETHGVRFAGSNESFASVIENASCVIFTWISTTFFEALFLGKKILLWDNSQIRDDVRGLLEEYGGFTTDIASINDFLGNWLGNAQYRSLQPEKLSMKFIEVLSPKVACERLFDLAQILSADFSIRTPPNPLNSG